MKIYEMLLLDFPERAARGLAHMHKKGYVSFMTQGGHIVGGTLKGGATAKIGEQIIRLFDMRND